MAKKKELRGRPKKQNNLVSVTSNIAVEEREGVARISALNRASMSGVIREAIVAHLIKFGMMYDNREGR